MNRERLEDLVDLYVDGEPGPEELAELRRILEDDPAARRLFYERMVGEGQLYRTCASESAAGRLRSLPAGKAVAVAAAALFVVAAGIAVFRPAPPADDGLPGAPAPVPPREKGREPARPRTVSGGFRAYDAVGRRITLSSGDRGQPEAYALGRGAEVVADGEPTTPEKLPSGCTVVLKISADDGTVSHVAARGAIQSGIVRSVDPARGAFVLTIGKEAPVDRAFALARNGRVFVDGAEKLLSDLAPGTQAEVQQAVFSNEAFEVRVGRAPGKERR
jgi:hypothetical protein